MSSNVMIWGILALAYAVFWFWYAGFNKKISPSEAEELVGRLKHSGLDIDEEEIRKTIIEDDGKDFVIVNLIKLKEPLSQSTRVLEKYARPFLVELLKRGGHPVMLGKAMGPAVEYWGLEPGAEEWDMVGVVRYRSRRDMLEMAAWPDFAKLHPFKEQAMEKTIAFPAGPWTTLGGVPLQLALILVVVGLVLTG